MDRFLAFSAEITAFTTFELQGTGQAKAYLDAVTNAIGPDLLDQLLDAYDRVRQQAQQAPQAQQTQDERDSCLRREIFGDEKLGPIARNIIKLWYVGIWYELPRAWIDAFGARAQNKTFMVSAAAYTEGLLWPTVGANPPGAKAPGYASWVDAPQLNRV